MSKILEATCLAGVVTCEGRAVLTAEILGEGVGPSIGALLMEQGKQYYIPKTSPDLETTLENLVDVLTTIATALTSIGAFMTGPTTAPPPTLAANVTSINATAAELTALLGMLK